MTTVFSYQDGTLPLLISVPHSGRMLSADIANRMSAAGLALADTDWHVARLYRFARKMGANVLIADFSRYVVDLNRSSTDEALYENQISTGLCPAKTFAGDAIYQPGRGVTSEEVPLRVQEYWQPYHARIASTLTALKQRFGYALLWDAHSIPGKVPTLFDGQLPDLNIGTNDGASCDPKIEKAVVDAAGEAPYSSVLNGRFRGGYITRNYGRPADRVCAVQLELAQRCYMDEKTMRYDVDAAGRLAQTIKRMVSAYLDAAREVYGSG